MNAQSSSQQGVQLSGVTVFRLDPSGRFLDRIEAKTARLENGYWRLEGARVNAEQSPPLDHAVYNLKTSLTTAQVRENFATPDAVSFWQLSSYIALAENAGLAAAGYRVQFYVLLLQPFYLAGMVLLAAAVSLRLFRFGGVQKMVLSGIGAGFLLYVMSKVTGDLSKAGLMPPIMAAGLPVLFGGLTGVLTSLVPGGRVTASITTRSIVARCPCWRGAIGVFAIAMMALGSFDSQPAHGQQRGIVQFPARPKPPATPPGQGILGATKTNTTDQMLLRAGEVNYDYVNERVSAIGNVQVYYKGTELEADQVIYDQKTKRMHAEGHIRLAEPDGKVDVRRHHRSGR